MPPVSPKHYTQDFDLEYEDSLKKLSDLRLQKTNKVVKKLENQIQAAKQQAASTQPQSLTTTTSLTASTGASATQLPQQQQQRTVAVPTVQEAVPQIAPLYELMQKDISMFTCKEAFNQYLILMKLLSDTEKVFVIYCLGYHLVLFIFHVLLICYIYYCSSFSSPYYSHIQQKTPKTGLFWKGLNDLLRLKTTIKQLIINS